MHVVDYLLEQNPSLINTQDKVSSYTVCDAQILTASYCLQKGLSPVIFASDRGHTAVVAKLLSCGADPELHAEKVI